MAESESGVVPEQAPEVFDGAVDSTEKRSGAEVKIDDTAESIGENSGAVAESDSAAESIKESSGAEAETGGAAENIQELSGAVGVTDPGLTKEMAPEGIPHELHVQKLGKKKAKVQRLKEHLRIAEENSARVSQAQQTSKEELEATGKKLKIAMEKAHSLEEELKVNTEKVLAAEAELQERTANLKELVATKEAMAKQASEAESRVAELELSLKEQAIKAADSEKKTSETESKLTEALDKALKTTKEADEKVASMDKELAIVKAEAEKLKLAEAQIIKLEQELATSKSKSVAEATALQENISKLEASLSASGADAKESEEKLKAEIESHLAELKAKETSLQSAEVKASDSASELASLSEKITALQEELNVTVGKAKEHEDAAKSHEETSKTFLNRSLELESLVASHDENTKIHQVTVQSLQAEIAEAKAKITNLEEEVANLEESLQNANKSAAKMEEKLKTARSKAAEAESLAALHDVNLQAHKDAVRSLQSEIEDTKAKATAATSQNEVLLKESGARHSELEEKLKIAGERGREHEVTVHEHENSILQSAMKIAELEGLVVVYEEKLKEAGDLLHVTKSELQGVKTDATKNSESLGELTFKVSELEKELIGAQQREEELEVKLKVANGSAAHHKSSARLVHSRSVELEELLSHHQAQAKGALDEVEVLKSTLEEAQLKHTQFDSEAKSLQEKLQCLEEEVQNGTLSQSDLTSKLALAEARVNGMLVDLELSRKKSEESDSIVKDLQSKYEVADRSANTIQSQLTAVIESSRSLTEEVSKLKSQATLERECLTAEISSLTSEKATLNAQLLETQKSLQDISAQREQETLKTKNFRSAKQMALEGDLRDVKAQLRDALQKSRELKELQHKLQLADEKNRELTATLITEQEKNTLLQKEGSELQEEVANLAKKQEESASTQDELLMLKDKLATLVKDQENFSDDPEETSTIKEQLTNLVSGQQNSSVPRETSQLNEKLASQNLEDEKLQAQLNPAISTRDMPGKAVQDGNLRKRKSKKGSVQDDYTAPEDVEGKEMSITKANLFSNGILSVLVAISVGSSLLSFYVTRRIYQ